MGTQALYVRAAAWPTFMWRGFPSLWGAVLLGPAETAERTLLLTKDLSKVVTYFQCGLKFLKLRLHRLTTALTNASTLRCPFKELCYVFFALEQRKPTPCSNPHEQLVGFLTGELLDQQYRELEKFPATQRFVLSQ
jgi:hypothetical protein